MAEIMMTSDVGVPQRRVGLPHHEINCELVRVLHRSARGGQALGLFVGAQCFNRLVQTHPPAPQDGDAGITVSLSPQVTGGGQLGLRARQIGDVV
jgi:hypothetical protein